MNKLKEIILKGNMPTQGMLVARLLVGGYLVYLSKSLFDGRKESLMNPLVLYGFTILFLIVGASLCIKAAYTYVLGYYVGGKLDEASDSETEAEIVQEGPDEEVILKNNGNAVIDVEESDIEELDQ